MVAKKWFSANNDATGADVTDPAKLYPESYQTIQVYDGRVVNDGWTVSVAASPFKEGSKVLTGAQIKIAGAKEYTTDKVGKLAGKSGFTIETDGTTNTDDVLKASNTARFYSDLKWDTDKVTLDVPGAVITTGNFASTITWTLAGTPDA
ncbi:MAG: WxL domain-containing protein [Pseudolactococcus laudensis]|uniref:WxL domain-containing protein n=1 Tax=Pseudolactococcus laudensis TaxID=1494461 RepID=UPI003F98E652